MEVSISVLMFGMERDICRVDAMVPFYKLISKKKKLPTITSLKMVQEKFVKLLKMYCSCLKVR